MYRAQEMERVHTFLLRRSYMKLLKHSSLVAVTALAFASTTCAHGKIAPISEHADQYEIYYKDGLIVIQKKALAKKIAEEAKKYVEMKKAAKAAHEPKLPAAGTYYTQAPTDKLGSLEKSAESAEKKASKKQQTFAQKVAQALSNNKGKIAVGTATTAAALYLAHQAYINGPATTFENLGLSKPFLNISNVNSTTQCSPYDQTWTDYAQSVKENFKQSELLKALKGLDDAWLEFTYKHLIAAPLDGVTYIKNNAQASLDPYWTSLSAAFTSLKNTLGLGTPQSPANPYALVATTPSNGISYKWMAPKYVTYRFPLVNAEPVALVAASEVTQEPFSWMTTDALRSVVTTPSGSN